MCLPKTLEGAQWRENSRTRNSHPEVNCKRTFMTNELICKFNKNFTSYHNTDMKILSGCYVLNFKKNSVTLPSTHQKYT